MRILLVPLLCMGLVCGSSGRADAQGCDGAWAPGAGFPGVAGDVYTSLTLPDGDVIVAGNFTAVGSLPLRGIGRYRPSTGGWSALGAGLNGAVRALARLPNGDIVAGGAFNLSGPFGLANIARWNGEIWSNLGTGFNAPVNALVVMPDGDLVAGGDFTATNNALTMRHVARWDGVGWSSLSNEGVFTQSYLDAPVSALLALPNGELIAAGYFGDVLQGAYKRVARWNGVTWSPLGSGMSGNPMSGVYVHALARLPNGDIVAGGTFTSAGAVSAPGTAVWNGASWSSLGSGAFGAEHLHVSSAGELFATGAFKIKRWTGAAWVEFPSAAATQASSFSRVYTLVELANGDWLVGGDSALTAPASGFERWNVASQSWDPTAVGGFDGVVRAFATLQNGDLVAAGSFTSVSGIDANRIARWNGSSWLPMGSGFNGDVNALQVMPNGDLIAAGLFSSADGAAVSSIARWNGSAWSTLGTGINGHVYALALWATSYLVAGGQFSSAGGVESQNLALWTGTTWGTTFSSALYSGVNGIVLDLEGTADGVLVAGDFTTAGGSPAVGLAGFGLFGWGSLATTVDGYFSAVKLHPTLGIIAAGSFGSINGVPSPLIARYDGVSWVPFGLDPSRTESNDVVATLLLQPDGTLIAGGSFGTSSNPYGNLVRRSGSSWEGFNGGVGSGVGNIEVHALHALGGGDFAAGGRFTTTGNGASSAFFAEWQKSDGSDVDADDFDDVCDNCPYVSNSTQSDAGGVGAATGADGIGDVCQCGDVTGDGRVLSGDVFAIRTALAASGGPLTAPERCSVGGAVDAGVLPSGARRDCDVEDVARLKRALATLQPGAAQVCESAVP